jgi:plasmid maintenance system antidote protein VapI
MSQSELAGRMGRPAQSINEIIIQKKALTEENALELERVLGTPASDWVAREGAYRLALARDVEKLALEGQTSWLELFPTKEMEQ